MMLEEVLRYVNNRFECGKSLGRFKVEGGSLDVVGLLDGQYFWVEGSVFNDGLHRFPADDMTDEEFDGAVVWLAVPRALSDIADEIEAWNAENASVVDSPLASESFGGYSYTKASGGAQGNEAPAAAWQVHFGARLRQWRKLSRDWA